LNGSQQKTFIPPNRQKPLRVAVFVKLRGQNLRKSTGKIAKSRFPFSKIPIILAKKLGKKARRAQERFDF
jgi:hypothetical protein